MRSTSNVQAGMVYGLPVRGTHAHSFPGESACALEDMVTAGAKLATVEGLLALLGLEVKRRC